MRYKDSLLFWLILPVLLCFPSYGHAQLWTGTIASDRATDWSTAGVEGGIPSAAWTQCGATIAAYSGSADTINTALGNCGTNQYVKLGVGTFNLTTGIHIAKDNVALRGSGADQTSLVITGGATVGCNVFFTAAVKFCTGANTQRTANWTGSGGQAGVYTKGLTTVTLSSSSNLAVGQPIFLDQNDDTSDGWPFPGDTYICSSVGVCSSQGGGDNFARPARSVMQVSKVTAINGNTVTISPGIILPNFRSAQVPGAYWFDSNVFIKNSGIEDLSIDFVALRQVDIQFVFGYNSWVKGVRSTYNDSAGSFVYHVNFIDSFRITIKDSYFFGPTTGPGAQTQYPIAVHNSAGLLMENNIFHGIQGALVTNGPYSGSVFAYNFFTGRQGPGVVLHGAGELMNLYEGNVTQGWYADVVHGTHAFQTLFRNAFVGNRFNSGSGTIGNAVHLQSHTRFSNVVGNVMGDSYFNTYQAVSATNDNAIYSLGWQGNASGSGTPGNDSNVLRTLMRWGNWDSVTNATRWCGNSSNTGWSTACASTSEVPSALANFPNPVPSTQTLPASLYLASRPNWWPAAKPWPSIGPDVTGGNITNMAGHAYTNPAADCYLTVMGGPTNGSGGPLRFNATECYGNSGSPSSVPSSPSNLNLTRFRGHPIVGEEGVHDAEESSAVPAGVPAADDRTGPAGPDPGGARA